MADIIAAALRWDAGADAETVGVGAVVSAEASDGCTVANGSASDASGASKVDSASAGASSGSIMES